MLLQTETLNAGVSELVAVFRENGSRSLAMDHRNGTEVFCETAVSETKKSNA